MNTESINNSSSTSLFMLEGQPGTLLNPTEIAARNLAISMLLQYSGHMLNRVAHPNNQEIANDCSIISRQCTETLVNTLDPSARSTAAGNVRDAYYSGVERSCGLGVASMCATLDPGNTIAWSMIYQLLPNDHAALRIQTEQGLQTFKRRDAERAMFHTIWHRRH